MRSLTSALTTVLGVFLTVSTVSAQQLPAPANAPQSKSGTAGATGPTSAAAAADSTFYGMTATRGARYLLRNGLDYINYKEYDRALKFLREAEARQKELNEAERLALKQGIERAEHGLREPADAEEAYSVTERSQPRRGFKPAQSDSQVAARAGRFARDNQPAHAPLASSTDAEGDDQGKPIRLTSSDSTINDSPGATNSPTIPGPFSPNRRTVLPDAHPGFDDQPLTVSPANAASPQPQPSNTSPAPKPLKLHNQAAEPEVLASQPLQQPPVQPSSPAVPNDHQPTALPDLLPAQASPTPTTESTDRADRDTARVQSETKPMPAPVSAEPLSVTANGAQTVNPSAPVLASNLASLPPPSTSGLAQPVELDTTPGPARHSSEYSTDVCTQHGNS